MLGRSLAARQRKEQGDAMLSGSEWYSIQASRAVNQVRAWVHLPRVSVHIDQEAPGRDVRLKMINIVLRGAAPCLSWKGYWQSDSTY